MNLYLAPMQSLTHLPFRKAYATVFPGAIDFAVSPFVSLTHGNVLSESKKFFDVLPENNKNAIPLIPQILGNEAPLFVKTANVLYDFGYEEVNWNLGCPMPRVSKKRRGSGLLPYPEEVQSILEYALPKIKPKLSVKMRLGYENPDEIEKLIPILNQANLTSVIMHPRVGVQLYEGSLFWDYFRFFLNEIKHPVVFNGNIFTKENYLFLRENFSQISDVMVGRGLLHNIFLPYKLKDGKEVPCKTDFFLFEETLFHEIQAISKTDEGLLNRMKEYWFYFSSLFEEPAVSLNKVVHCYSIENFRKTIKEFMLSCEL